MKRANLAFTRTGQFMMTGGAAIDVPNDMSWDEILELAQSDIEFAEFLPLDLKLSDDEWEFEPVEEDTPDED